MHNIVTFTNEEFGDIRSLTIDNETWFVGKDIAKALGYKKPENAMANHVDKEDKTTTLIQGTGSNYKSNAVCINESGLYSLILSSKLNSAKRFKRWVTAEVLPQIRKTGGYIPVQQEDDESTIMARALLIAQKTLDQKDALIKKQTKQLIEQQPKVEYADWMTDSSDTIDLTEMANLLNKNGLNIGRNKLYEFLRKEKILKSSIGKKNLPYQRYLDENWFKVVQKIGQKDYFNSVYNKTLVTGKGQQKIFKLVKEKYFNLAA